MNYKDKREFELDLKKKADYIDQNLKRYLARTHFDAPEVIINAVDYSLFADGKRIRPILTLEIAKALEQNEKLVEPLAEAIELVHTYSLIHDDLPAMDDAKLRRGKETNHVVFGEDVAILAGDSLLNMAIERALEGAPYVPYLDAKNYLLAMRLLFNNTGMNGLIGGQVADTCKQAKGTDFDDPDYIETHKTGALISASILCGCIPFFGMENPQVRTLFEYSKIIGRIYQIVDDILDQTSSSDKIGKDVKADTRNNTSSFVVLNGVQKAKREVENLRRDAYEELDKLEGDFDFLYYFTDYICSRTR